MNAGEMFIRAFGRTPTPREIRGNVDRLHPRTLPGGKINAAHVAAEATLRERYGHPAYIAALDGPGNFTPPETIEEGIRRVAREELDDRLVNGDRELLTNPDSATTLADHLATVADGIRTTATRTEEPTMAESGTQAATITRPALDPANQNPGAVMGDIDSILEGGDFQRINAFIESHNLNELRELLDAAQYARREHERRASDAREFEAQIRGALENTRDWSVETKDPGLPTVSRGMADPGQANR